MIERRAAHERGHVQLDWLNSHHSFSFGHYHDPAHMGWSALRVINDDTVQPGKGFGTHGHRDMEILSYVLEGALEHRDSMGSGSVLKPGNVQLMSAGTGVQHSEFNPSASDPVHFLQIWLLPNRQSVAPSYQERHIQEGEKRGQLKLLASGNPDDDALFLHQDARIYATLLNGDEHIDYDPPAGRQIYLHVARGSIRVNEHEIKAGDGLKIKDEPALLLAHGHEAEVLLFELP
ncbi:MAG: quercetin 2,3-dioxygenase [Pusillimonas sp.]|jgi:redox-sensitive bicupin YhaK (pirin superfamily)|nr:quercetin 2,3-dioxygenase [Pusillimonas sp.]HCP77596.1 quercetin 2,3-dioxygenase [Pusillimonas sp.]|tara:strand:- start:303076 stop:303774 length:699 start_codon:yes stop_codon:yes gene_type:complete